jgi:type IV pilus assembly protein PilM
MSTADGIRQGIYSNSVIRRVAQWLDTAPHPAAVCEIAPGYVAAARWNHNGTSLDSFAVEPISPGALRPTAVETNILDANEIRSAVGKVFSKLDLKGQDIALLIPDPVIRVFVLHFDVFPRSTDEAIPLLRWRLKKSVPFEAEETLISFMRQSPREEGVDVVTGLARLRIIREYEQLVESLGMTAGVLMSSTLAALPLLNDRQPALLARVAGRTLTTAIAREGVLCGFRCMELSVSEPEIPAQVLLDEIYPLTAYYQDSWSEGIAVVRLAGLGERTREVSPLLERELNCPVGALLPAAETEGRISSGLQPLVDRGLDALVGWSLNRGA